MKNCKNRDNKKPCREDANCEECGISTCSPNYAYHVCVSNKGRKDVKTKGFSIIELLTVMSIIVLLMAMILPSMNAMRKFAKVIVQKNHFRQIGTGLEMFRNDYDDDYPESDPIDLNGDPYDGGMVMCEAVMGQDGLGIHGDSILTSDDDGLYLSVGTGPPLYTPAQLESLKKRSVYLDTTKIDVHPILFLFANITPFASTDPNGGPAVICDVFKRNRAGAIVYAGLPVLYYKADPRKLHHNIAFPDDPQNIYDYKDNQALVGLVDNAVPFYLGRSEPGDVFYEETLGKFNTIDRPYNADSYILLSAGHDGEYGTEDDVYNF